MEQRGKSKKSLGVGTASILMIFVLLTLVTFAVLSLSSAKADSRLSEKTVQHAKQYYEAENKAELKIAQIDSLLNSAFSESNIFEQIQKIDGIEIDVANGIIQYGERINKKQFLNVVIRFKWDEVKQKYDYEKAKWETVVDASWNANDKLPVFQPEN